MCLISSPKKTRNLATVMQPHIKGDRTCSFFASGAANKCVFRTADKRLILKMTLCKMFGKGQEGVEPVRLSW